MPPDTFAEFLQTSLDECTKSDQNMILHETYILFLFTQILREIMSYLAIYDNSPYFSILNEQQTQLIVTITHLTGPPPLNFGYHRTLPNAENWAPISEPSRAQTWIVWPDIPEWYLEAV